MTCDAMCGVVCGMVCGMGGRRRRVSRRLPNRFVRTAALVLVYHVSGPVYAAGSCRLDPGPERTVTAAIDGETVALDDGSELRLIGIVAPRAIDIGAAPGTWPLEAAARTALEQLTIGRTVRLAFVGPRRDRYERQLAYAFVLPKPEATPPADPVWLQGLLLGRGLARANVLPRQRECIAELLAHEQIASEARLGLWADPAYGRLDAAKARPIGARAGTFQIVEGRVARVGEGRAIFYLNFGPNRRRDFSVELARRDRELLGLIGGDAKSLAGKPVRVRGWIEERFGAPMIDLSAGGLIELTGDASEPAPAIERPSSAPPPTVDTKTPGLLIEAGRP